VGIGASILLIAVGAILTFALNVSIGWLDLDVVGWIMMLAGAIGLFMTTVIWAPRRRSAVVTRERDAVIDDRPVVTPDRSVERERIVERDTRI
jgi:hypothetical protein